MAALCNKGHYIFVLWFLMAALSSRAGHYIFALCFLSSIFFISSPNLSGRRSDVYRTSTHGVALVRIYNARVKCAARGSLQIQDAQKSPFWNHRTILSGYIFGTKTRIDNRKQNLLNTNTSSTCPDNIVNFGLLSAEICWRVWGTPANFNGFRVLAASAKLCGVQQRAPPLFGRAAITLGIGPHF